MLVFASYGVEEDKKLRLNDFAVDIMTENGGYVYTVKWWNQDAIESTQYYMTLPYSAKDKMVKANFECDNPVYFDGIEIENGSILPNLHIL